MQLNTRAFGFSLAAVAMLALPAAAAEISLEDAYHNLYGQDVEPSNAPFGGLSDELVCDDAAYSWDADDITALQVVAYEGDSLEAVFLKVGDAQIPLYQPTPWNGDSRGWLPENGSAVIDIAQVLQQAGFDPEEAEFSLAVGQTEISHSNSWVLRGQRAGELVVAFNAEGVEATDADANEPIILLYAGDEFEEVCQ